MLHKKILLIAKVELIIFKFTSWIGFMQV